MSLPRTVPEKGHPAAPHAGRYVKITIADNGSGIPAENLARIFDPYFTTKAKGSGLGLSTALSIIQETQRSYRDRVRTR